MTFLEILTQKNSATSHCLDSKTEREFTTEMIEQILHSMSGLKKMLVTNFANVLEKKASYDYNEYKNHQLDCEHIKFNIQELIPAIKEINSCTTQEAQLKILKVLKLDNYSIHCEYSTRNISYTSFASSHLEINEKFNQKQQFSMGLLHVFNEKGGQLLYEPHGIMFYFRNNNNNNNIISLPISELPEHLCDRNSNSFKEKGYSQRCREENRNIPFVLGHDNSSILPVNITPITQTDDTPIVFCQDPVLAYLLEFRIQDSQSLKGKYTVTTTYGSSDYIDKVNFSCFEDKNIIFIPAPTDKEFSHIEKYCKCFEAVDVISLKILPYSILPYPLAKYDEDIESFTKFEQHILRKSLILNEQDEIPRLCDSIFNNALSIKDFLTFYNKLIDENIEVQNQQEDYSLTTLLNTPIDENKELLWENIINPKELTLVYSESDSGKSFFTNSLAVVMASANEFLGIEAKKSSKVLILDAETPRNRIHERFTVFQKAFPNMNTENIIIRALDSIDGLLIDTPEGQDNIRKVLKDSKPCIVIFDNFSTLTSKGGNSANHAQNYIKFARKLGEKGIASILVHHTGKETDKSGGNVLGSCQFINLFQCIISIKKPTNLDSYESDIDNATFEKYKAIQKEGKRFSCVVFEKIKPYDTLLNKLHILYYDSSNETWDNYTPVSSLEVSNESFTLPNILQQPSTELPVELKQAIIENEKLTNKELTLEIVSNLYLLQHNELDSKAFKKQEIIKETTENTSSKIRDCFQKLQEVEILTSNGSSSNKVYRINEKFMPTQNIPDITE